MSHAYGPRRPSWVALRLGVLLALALATQGQAFETFTGLVVDVLDGEVLRVVRQRIVVTVRLEGIAAPLLGQPWNREAALHLRELADGQIVTVSVVSKDAMGRRVADVYLPDGRNLSHAQVQAGMAWWFWQVAPHDRVLALLEAEARDKRVGLWADANPVAPWLWRTDVDERHRERFYNGEK